MNPDNLFSILGTILGILFFFGAIGGGIYFVMNLRKGEPIHLPLRGMFRLYIYILLVVSLVLLSSGLGHLVRYGLASGFGYEFSYNPDHFEMDRDARFDSEGKPIPLTDEEETQRREEGLVLAYKEGLFEVISYSIVGGILWIAHAYGRRKLETVEERTSSLVNRLYLILLLLIFGIATLASLPSAAFEAVRYLVLGNDGSYRGQAPGGELATAIVSLPIWLAYLRGVIVTIRRSG